MVYHKIKNLQSTFINYYKVNEVKKKERKKSHRSGACK